MPKWRLLMRCALQQRLVSLKVISNRQVYLISYGESMNLVTPNYCLYASQPNSRLWSAFSPQIFCGSYELYITKWYRACFHLWIAHVYRGKCLWKCFFSVYLFLVSLQWNMTPTIWYVGGRLKKSKWNAFGNQYIAPNQYIYIYIHIYIYYQFQITMRQLGDLISWGLCTAYWFCDIYYIRLILCSGIKEIVQWPN